MKFLIAIFLLVGIIVSPATPPLSCVRDATNLTLLVWGRTYPSFSINDEYWEEFVEVDGDSVWVGYPQGWDMPDDLVGSWKVIGVIEQEPMMVWIWSSATTNNYYIFPFDNTTPFTDANGDYYGVHPCDGVEVGRKAVNDFIIKVIKNNQG